MPGGSWKRNWMKDLLEYVPRLSNVATAARDNCHCFFHARSYGSSHQQSIWPNIFKAVNTGGLVQSH